MKRVRKKIGLPPGAIVFTGNRKVEKIWIHYLRYNSEFLEEKKFDNHKRITFHQSKDHEVDWYDIRGLHDTDLIELLGNTFTIHPLILEDVVDTYQRPKYEEFDQGNFIVIKALSFDATNLKVQTEQVALFFRNDLVITFQEAETDLFEVVRGRIHSGRGRVRLRGADYLVFALLDSIIERYYLVLDEIKAIMDDMEEEVLANPSHDIRERIHNLKKQLLLARKTIAPLRDAIGRFSKSDSPLIEPSTLLFVRDLFDQIIQLTDMTESYRDSLNGLQDLYLSEISFKMNQVMQVLTIITTIFVPLSFLAGLYGMNFEYIPELHFKYGYFILLGLMATIGIGLLIWFKRRRWL